MHVHVCVRAHHDTGVQVREHLEGLVFSFLQVGFMNPSPVSRSGSVAFTGRAILPTEPTVFLMVRVLPLKAASNTLSTWPPVAT